jgi:hypothetical protein
MAYDVEMTISDRIERSGVKSYSWHRVPRLRRSHPFATHARTNVGIKGTLIDKDVPF